MTNPYAPPETHSPAPKAAGTPSKGLKVLATLQIVFGALGVVGVAMGSLTRDMAKDPVSRRIVEITWEGEMATWTKVSQGLGALLIITLIAAGIGNLKVRRWGRTAT